MVETRTGHDTPLRVRRRARITLAVMQPTGPARPSRHSAASNIRKQYGLEAARCMLGHRMAAVTEIYASEFDEAKAAEIAAKIG